MQLFFFSGTGNSLAVARQLANAFPGTQLSPVTRTVKSTLIGEIGLIFPIHMNGVPKPIRRFLTQMDFSAVDYLFAVATHGGYPGNVGGLMNRILLKHAGTDTAPPRLLDEFFPLEMINNTPKGVAPRFLMRMDWAESIRPERVEAMQQRCGVEVDDIIRSVGERSREYAGQYRNGARVRGTMGDRLLWHLSSSSSPKLPFLLDTDACTGCGICAKLCPTRRVTLSVNSAEGGKVPVYPAWPLDRECYYCYACFNFCPEQAVGVQHYTRKDGRYHYPGVTAEDIAALSSVTETE